MTDVLHAALAGFPAIGLRSTAAECWFVPELGGRMASLRATRGSAAREWLYRPTADLRLWRNPLGDAFTRSTHVGLDECLPSVDACVVRERRQHDHGEVWTLPWTVEHRRLDDGCIDLRVDLPLSPFRLERSATLAGATLRLAYTLTNRGSEPEPWSWAFHALFSFVPGDRLELPGDVSTVLTEAARGVPLPPGPWSWPEPLPNVRLDRNALGGDRHYVKTFAGPLTSGSAALVAADGQRLDLRWDAQADPWIGIWLTRGGYQGQHGWAVEPTNVPTGSLAKAGATAPVLAPGATTTWWVDLLIT